MKEHAVVIVPGLSDGKLFPWLGVMNWERSYALIPLIYTMPWAENGEGFSEKLERLLAFIDATKEQYKQVSLLGISAGGSAVLNAYAARLNTITAVINVCGRVAQGKAVFPTLKIASRGKPTFFESVLRAEEVISHLPEESKQKILTLRSQFWDEIVPTSTIPIRGALNETIPMAGHIPSILYALLFPHKIIEFIDEIMPRA